MDTVSISSAGSISINNSMRAKIIKFSVGNSVLINGDILASRYISTLNFSGDITLGAKALLEAPIVGFYASGNINIFKGAGVTAYDRLGLAAEGNITSNGFLLATGVAEIGAGRKIILYKDSVVASDGRGGSGDITISAYYVENQGIIATS